MAQINLNADPAASGVIQIMPVSDPTVPGVVQVNISADPTIPGVVQANINFDPTIPGIVPVTFSSSAGVVPLNLSAPLVYGVPQVGQVLTVTAGKYLGASTYAYQWYRNQNAISGQTGTSYTCISSDIGQTINVQETATNGAGAASPVMGALPVFALYRTTLAGTTNVLVTSLPTQLMNHARQSPTSPLIAFTTYNVFTGNPSYATEAGGSLNTEIRLVNTLTGQIIFAVPPNPLYQYAWPSWLSDGSGFNFTTTNTVSTKQGIGQYKLAANSWSVIYDPGDFSFTSSHVNSNSDIVMAGTTPVSGGNVSYLYVLSKGVRTQLTTVPTLIAGIVAGDMGPSWSPDHTKVACIRIVSAGVTHIVIIAVGSGPSFTNGGETIVTPPGSAQAFDGIPEFSADGASIITYYTDPANGAANGIYSMSAVDGSGRTQVPLLANYADTLCSFIPNGGASHPFVYSAQQRFFIDIPAANSVLPVITGTPVHGNTLSCSTGTWTGGGSGFVFKYQWVRSTTGPISGATANTYLLAVADEGATITCVVTAQNSGGSPQVTTAPTATIT